VDSDSVNRADTLGSFGLFLKKSPWP